MSYSDLDQKTSAAVSCFNELSDRIKSMEKQLSDNGELQKQIVNYSKTRAVYTEYPKAGYSKKFREEYASVLQEKRKAYAEYKQVRTEIRELQNVKANIDYLLGSSDKHKIEKEF